MEYISECCHKKIDLNEQLKNVSAGFCENAILCCNSIFMEKNAGSGLVRKKNVPKIGETENLLSYHRIEFAGNEEFNLLYLPNEIYDLKEEDFNNMALIKCKFNKKIKEDIQNEILEVTVLKVTMLSDFIELYPLNYTGKAIESFEENNEYLTIDKFGKWKCYISNIEGDLENWQITYTDDQNVEHCLIRGFWCMSDEDIASVGNVIYSEEENKKFWKDVLASDGIKISGTERFDK